MEEAFQAQKVGTECPFTVFTKADNVIVGSTRYMDVRPSQKGLEIGWTWYSSKVWGTAVNPECKFLLLRHAFEDWGAIRVQLKTDNNNVHSQRAISKLGAKFEGRLRNHRLRRDGSYGDSMMYSVTVEEWRDKVAEGLQARIDGFKARL
jgi:RimJ/RimL family protein N-acetyltransferase